MKNNRDMFYENAGYFATPPGFGSVPMMPNANVAQSPNMGYSAPLQNPQGTNIGIFSNNNYETLEQKVNRLERFCKRLDSRINKLENMYNNPNNQDFSVTENNDIYMI